MSMLCPECLGVVVTADGVTATCTVHGGEYRILYARGMESPAMEPPLAGVAPPAPPVPQVSAPLLLASEAPPLPASDAPPSAVTDAPPLPADDFEEIPLAEPPPAPTVTRAATVMCRMHPEMPAIAYCQWCGAPTCTTCDFAFPGNIHLCVTCATTPRDPVTGGRKTAVIASYVIAAWTTLATALVFTGALMPSHGSKESIGIIIMILVFIPGVVGLALSFSSMDKRLGNPAKVWVAVIWNSLVLGVWALLVTVGLIMKA